MSARQSISKFCCVLPGNLRNESQFAEGIFALWFLLQFVAFISGIWIVVGGVHLDAATFGQEHLQKCRYLDLIGSKFNVVFFKLDGYVLPELLEFVRNYGVHPQFPQELEHGLTIMLRV